MTDTNLEPQPPVGKRDGPSTSVPVAPHWDVRSHVRRSDAGPVLPRPDSNARLMLFAAARPPVSAGNRERINRDAERENVQISWDLGYDEE